MWASGKLLHVGISATHPARCRADLSPTCVDTPIICHVIQPFPPVRTAELSGLPVAPKKVGQGMRGARQRIVSSVVKHAASERQCSLGLLGAVPIPTQA